MEPQDRGDIRMSCYAWSMAGLARPRGWIASGGVLVAGGAAFACGPSFQAIYEGNARFEHCYALEENAQASMPDKAACWRDWSERYTYGQTRDRIHYATARYVALSEVREIPTDEALMMAAPGETPRRSTITAPTPTSAFAPPPKVLDINENATTGTSIIGTTFSSPPSTPTLDAGPPMASFTPAPPPLPASSCSDKCGSEYQACSGGCPAGPGAADVGAARAKACQTCQTTYRGCMRACFK
jgi:hypothetical protein